ncbi:hypothetical protein RND81_14G194600 [Saponaria officinalis]|uniref:ATP-dependent DNA helicase n=1 Tax=Saponaria officinalis TaxID=3572 RepID=A0AAW1GRR8_SAPOF
MLPIQTGQQLPIQPLKLPETKQCPDYGALKFAFESLHFCYGNGQIKLPENEYPPELAHLFTSKEEYAIHFRKYACLYNNLFAFSSIGGNFDVNTKKGIYVLKLHGQIYHNVPSLIPSDAQHRYLQLYFYDGQHEAENRLACFPELHKNVIDILMHITQTNPYAKFFRTLKELEINEETKIIINRNTVLDQRVYNAPASDEVAVIWSKNTSSCHSESPHILVIGKSNESHRIMHYYGCYDPLQYPLLFPCGECGWNQGLPRITIGRTQVTNTRQGRTPLNSTDGLLSNDRQVSCREYYCYKLQSRPNNMLLRAGRCLQQYMVDMYVKIENTRLDFFRKNQDTIIAELYQGILDTLESGENCAANVGRRVILPPTFLGGPRDMKKRYLNAMSLEAQNRPDLVARVFRAKLLSLKKKIMKQHIFGEAASLIYVVEFQTRGLLHTHFLIILKPSFRMKCPEDFDKFVSAEIPSESEVHLRKTVLRHMMHGPCGQLNLECQCMKHKGAMGKCKLSYPMYRRRNSGEAAIIRKHKLDNRWVIPYNPYLLALFDCHLNVEVCSTIQAVKYLYKYVYKGHDRVSFNVVQNKGPIPVDEIEQYQSGRWVSPCEAAWRIFGFDLFEMHPPVMPLPIHLPNMQTIQIRPHERLDTIVSTESRTRTPLTEFFRMNEDNGGGDVLYGDFTEKYRWGASKKTWFRRKNKLIVIGRLAFVAPTEGERYFLRLLLLHVRGLKSFEDLLTVDGYRCCTFQEAALKLRLLEEDDAVDMCLKEACEIQMPFALRRLFSTVLIFCQPSDLTTLWTKYYKHLSEDFSRQNGKCPDKDRHLTVRAVEQYLEAMGITLKCFGLEHLAGKIDDEIQRTKDITDALDAPIPQECIDCQAMLNPAQQGAFNQIIHHVKHKIPGIVLPTTTSGIAASNIPSGRTAHSRFKIYSALLTVLHVLGRSPSGTCTCVALGTIFRYFWSICVGCGLSVRGTGTMRDTVVFCHPAFLLGPMFIPVSTVYIILINLLCIVNISYVIYVIIVEFCLVTFSNHPGTDSDEESMARKENVESLETLLRDLCNPHLPFGGKVVVFGEDFRQILPVVPHKSQKEVVDASLVSSHLWPGLIRFRLVENIRARQEPNFSNFLLALGNGELQYEDHGFVELPGNIVRSTENAAVDPLIEITSTIFDEPQQGTSNPEIFTTRAILTPMNEDVDALNSVLIEKFPGNANSYKSFDTMLDDNCNVYPAEFISKLCPGEMSPYDLVLKENFPVILLRNILPSFGLCNGTRLVCSRFFPNLIDCNITTGHHKGEHVFIPRVKLRPSASNGYPFQFQRKQFPIKLSFAMTINKSQGQTLNQVAVYLPQPCFSPGQLYMALSRARKAAQVSVFAAKNSNGLPQTYAKNVVSYEVLRLAKIL